MQREVRIQGEATTAWAFRRHASGDTGQDGVADASDQPWFVPDAGAFRQALSAGLTSGASGAAQSSFQVAIVAASQPELSAGTAITAGNAVTTNSSVHALRVDVARSTYTVPGTGAVLDGSGLKIGILSDSFNLKGGESTDIANGDLPAASQIDILKEGSAGGDEGRAMAELVHSIAPGATIYFYTATSSETDFANGITALANAGCTFIVDDVSYTNEAFYEDTGVITKAVETVIGRGVNYFSAAGNEGDNYYEAAFSAVTETLTGIGVVSAHNVGDGSGGTSP